MAKRSISRRKLLAASSLSLLGARNVAWSQAPGAQPPAARPPSIPDTEWHNYANDLANTRYVPLDQINASNFNKLEMVWRVGTEALGPRWDADFQATPIIAKGRIISTAGSRRDVIALDGATGEMLWLHREDEGERLGSRGGPGFGLSYWTDGTKERVIYVTIGYRLISLDAKTGIPDPTFGVNGVVDLRLNNDQEMDMVKGVVGLHAPPLVVKDTIVVGAAPTPTVKGYIRGFDVKTGRRKWLFHTIPRKGEFGYETWIEANQAEAIGNTGSWAPMSADPDLGLVYVGVELPSGDEQGIKRQGNALFGETLVALDIETGVRKWHFQLVHHGLWDHDIPCAAILCDIPVDGKIVKAIAQPSKQAYVYVLNRETGEPVWPIPEKPVAKGDVPGEWYSPTQPMPSKPPAFDRQGVGPDDLIDFTPEIKARALAIAAKYRMGPLFTAPAFTQPDGPWATMTAPGTQGGANWPGGSYDPETHMLYVYSKSVVEAIGASFAPGSTSQIVTQLTMTRGFNDQNGGGFGGAASITGGGGRAGRVQVDDSMNAPIIRGLMSVAGLPIIKPPYGRITAIDMSKGTIVWQVAHGETPDVIKNHPLLKGLNIPRTGQASILGTLTTKTLVICGDGGIFTDSTGRKAARLRAYDKVTGEEKGAVLLPMAQTGAAMTYMLGGRQYIVTAMGSSNGAALVAYRLPANA